MGPPKLKTIEECGDECFSTVELNTLIMDFQSLLELGGGQADTAAVGWYILSLAP